MFGVSFHWQARHFFRGSRYRTATIVTTRHTFERRNAVAQVRDDISVIVHLYPSFVQLAKKMKKGDVAI
jgi:hypothetical protein